MTENITYPHTRVVITHSLLLLAAVEAQAAARIPKSATVKKMASKKLLYSKHITSSFAVETVLLLKSST